MRVPFVAHFARSKGLRPFNPGFGLAVLLAFGCRVSEERYQSDRAQAECAWALRCYDDAVLTFYGWDTEETCILDVGPEIAADMAGCVYDPKAARACVKELEEHPCPAEGEDPTLPLICMDVATSCPDDTSGDDTGGGETGTEE